MFDEFWATILTPFLPLFRGPIRLFDRFWTTILTSILTLFEGFGRFLGGLYQFVSSTNATGRTCHRVKVAFAWFLALRRNRKGTS